MQHQHIYGTVRKSCQPSPIESSKKHDRIPEYSEDIYPYATFHLPEHESESVNIPLNHIQIPSTYNPRRVDDSTIFYPGTRGKSFALNIINLSTSSIDKNITSEYNPMNTENIPQQSFEINESELEAQYSLNGDCDVNNKRIRGETHCTRESITAQDCGSVGMAYLFKIMFYNYSWFAPKYFPGQILLKILHKNCLLLNKFI